MFLLRNVAQLKYISILLKLAAQYIGEYWIKFQINNKTNFKEDFKEKENVIKLGNQKIFL